ncbi:MAG: bacteriohemerythrin [bacterium]
MALFNWSNNYSVGIKQIDDQHKHLVDLINELHDSMKVGKGKEVLGLIIKKLTDYTVFHFGTEEKLFKEYGYPDMKIHVETHNKLVNQVKALQLDFNKGKAVLTMEVMNFLKEWLTNHILGTDKKYTAFLNSKGVV